MNRQPVSSSNLRSVGYDPAAHVLEIEFHSGGIYQYTGVPASIHTALMQAGSKGSYFHDHIKDRYSTRKIG
jgi:hypothetical protein